MQTLAFISQENRIFVSLPEGKWTLTSKTDRNPTLLWLPVWKREALKKPRPHTSATPPSSLSHPAL